MTDPFRRQKIQNWAAEFADSDLVRRFPGELQEHAARLAETFLLTACQTRNVEPGALNESDIRTGLIKGAGSLALLPQARASVPEFCAVFLEMLQTMGRVAGGCALPVYVRGLAKVFTSEVASQPKGEARPQPAPPKVKPFVRPGSRLYPNDPCPCGSGKKYKKCCERLLE